MTKRHKQAMTARCHCGQTTITLEGKPITTAACYCTSCRQARHILKDISEASEIMEEDQGTHMILIRKDRVFCQTGMEHLRDLKLQPSSKTRRFVAVCCHTPMALEFTKGHWLSVYARRLPPDQRSAVDLRTMTADLPPDVRLDQSIPTYSRHSAAFMFKLLTTWAAMGFRAPTLDWKKHLRWPSMAGQKEPGREYSQATQCVPKGHRHVVLDTQ